jgi:tetratricopeptide (TPR) repeat protein
MKAQRILFFLALVLLPLLTYLPTLTHELIWDSRPMIMENSLLQGDFSLSAPFASGYWASTSQRSAGYDYYRPLMVLSFMAERAVWGLDPFRLRLVNVFIFIVALFILYFFLRRQRAGPETAGMAVLLFALFPLNLDNITWVVERCGLLMLLFGLLSLYLFDLFLEKRSSLIALLSVFSFLLALFSKEAALFFLPLFFLHALQRGEGLGLPVLAADCFAVILHWGVKSAVIGHGHIPLQFFPSLLENGRVLLGVLGYYLRSLVFPFRYDMFLPVDAVQTVSYMGLGLAFAVLLLLLPWLGRKSACAVQAWIWVVPFLAGHLLMVFTPIYPFSISTRYLQLPAIGLAWVLAHVLRSLPRPRGTLVLVLLLSAQGAAVIANGRRYRDETAFWADALRSCPNDSFFLSKYGGQLLQDGDVIGAEIHLRRALNFTMKNSTAAAVALQLAETGRRQARYDESLDWLQKTRALSLDLVQAQYRLNLLLNIHKSRGELPAAEAAVREMAAAMPAPRVKEILVELYLAFASWDKAMAVGAEPGRVARMQAAFRSMTPAARAAYFADRGCFACAWNALSDTQRSDITAQMTLARLALLAGQEADARRRIGDLARAGQADFRILNSLGNIFFELQRADEARHFYRLSLRLKPQQSALGERLDFLQRVKGR